MITLALENKGGISGFSSSKTLILPGVAITKCGLVIKVFAWFSMSIPPTTTVHRKCKHDPSALNCSANWYASSLVGVTTSPKMPKGSSARRCRIGNANAAVLPLPVCARPSTSRPARIFGMQWVCTGVGLCIPSSLQVCTAHSARPRLANLVVMVVVVSWSRFVDFSICGVFASMFWAVVLVLVLVVAVGLERLVGFENRGKSLSTKASWSILFTRSENSTVWDQKITFTWNYPLQTSPKKLIGVLSTVWGKVATRTNQGFTLTV